MYNINTHRYVWRLVLHPWGHDERGCYSVFLELVNLQDLPPDHHRFVRLEFAMHAWDTAYQVFFFLVRSPLEVSRLCGPAECGVAPLGGPLGVWSNSVTPYRIRHSIIKYGVPVQCGQACLEPRVWSGGDARGKNRLSWLVLSENK